MKTSSLRKTSGGWARHWLVVAACSLLGASTGSAEPLAGAASVMASREQAALEAERDAARRYAAIVRRVAGMTENERVIERAGRHGLDVLNVLWEDTGRDLGSSVGPNISDVTIEVQLDGGRRTALMPVLRHPNFSDKTGDVRLDRIWLPVGNQRAAGTIERVSLRELLDDPMSYMSKPDAGRIRSGSLLAPRDSHALVSAQAAYQATATGTPTGAEIKQLARQIRKVYADADYVGSLVLPTAADRERPTAWTSMTSAGSAPPDAPMCSDFAGLVERNLCM